MPIKVDFRWNRSALFERVALGVVDGLERTGSDGHNVWGEIAPVSNDPRTSGDLRRMFSTRIESGETKISLILLAYARHAKFVEFGTFKDPAQAPMRRTAGMILPALPGHIKAAMREI